MNKYLITGATNNNGDYTRICNMIMKYGKNVAYSVNCQFSIWKKEALLNCLNNTMNPWEFETQLKLDEVYCYVKEFNCIKYIEQSAISQRQPGKIN